MTSGSRIAVFSSENQTNIPIYPLDVFVVTEAGQAQLSGGTTRLPADALTLLVLLDGKANVGDVEHKALPVIMLTADARRESVSRGLVAGVRAVLGLAGA